MHHRLVLESSSWKSTQISEKTRTYCITLTLDQEYIGHIGGNKSTCLNRGSIEVTLNGLSDEYDGFITSIVSWSKPYNVGEIEALLMAQEQRLKKNKKNELFLVQAHIA